MERERQIKRRPLFGGLVVCRHIGRVADSLGTIQNADRIGLELDDKLLDRVLDGLFAIGHLDRAVVLASDEFALHVDEAAFNEAFSGLAKRVSKGICYVPLRFLLPVAAVVLPGLLGRDAETQYRRTVRKSFTSGALPV